MVLAVLVCAVAMGGQRSARADSFTDARKAFEEGKSLYQKGEFGKAAERYDAAYRMSRSPVILFNVAQARRRQFQKDGNYDHLVASAKLYKEFIDKANPGPRERSLAESNLEEVKTVSVEEAKKRFGAAGEAMKLSQYDKAIAAYDAAYELSGRVTILYNLAQAERRQFEVDFKLERLARAESLVRNYRSQGGDQVDPKVIDELLEDLKTQRTEYQRKREAQSRRNEPPTMKNARAAYERGDFAAALIALDQAESIKGNGRLLLGQIYRLRGQAAVMANKHAVAVDAFKRYLALEPAADGTGLSEQSKVAFIEALEYWKSREPLKIEHLPPGKVAPKKKVTVPVRVASDPLHMIVERQLRYRREGSADWVTLSMREGTDAVELPANPMPAEKTRDYKVQYYISATDAHENELDNLGTAAAPLAFLVTKDAIKYPPPIYKRWWFWAGIGAVAAGSIATYAIIQDGELPAEVVGNVSM